MPDKSQKMKEILKTNPLLRSITQPAYRSKVVADYLLPPLKEAGRWLIRSRETTNFTYDLTTKNKRYLAEMLSVVLGEPAEKLEAYMRELEEDSGLRRHVAEVTAASELGFKADQEARFHKRLGWYALVRASKPSVVVETGVDKGLGAVVLCAALLRNRAEGAPGRYFGTDLNPRAGYLLTGQYAEVGRMLYGDSIESLKNMSETIDIFVNDSDHSSEYEGREYEVIRDKLSKNAIIVGDNAHVTDELLRFSRNAGRSFLFWKEEPEGHWYPGGGIGISWLTS